MKLEELLENRAFTKKITKKILLLITFAALLIFFLLNIGKLGSAVGWAIGLALPFFLGIAVAYVVNVLLKFYEQIVFFRLNRKGGRIWLKIRRGICMVLSYVTIFALLGAIVLFVVPELVKSMRVLTDNAPQYINNLVASVTKYLQKLNVTQEQINALKIDWGSLFGKATQFTSDFMGSIFTVTMNVFNAVFTAAMSFIFSVYMLSGKEKLTRNARRVLYAFLPKAAAQKIIDVAILSNRQFSNFVRGQLTEALVWFVLAYLGTTILKLPYALLMSTVVAICSLIPIIGPYISMCTNCLILVLVDPWLCVSYIIFYLLAQQFEGNVIYPRVVGTSVGLPGIWVLLAIIVGGNLMGIAGMLLGIPICSVLYILLRDATAKYLKGKGITPEQIARNDPSWTPNKKDDT